MNTYSAPCLPPAARSTNGGAYLTEAMVGMQQLSRGALTPAA